MSDRIEAMKVLSAGNTIMMLILGAILGLQVSEAQVFCPCYTKGAYFWGQGGQEYARRIELRELAKLDEAEKERAGSSTEKDKKE